MIPVNKLIIITAPSGAGKTSITHYLLNKYPQLAFSVSAATRPPRGDEKNGVDYYFMSVEEFQQKINNNDFINFKILVLVQLKLSIINIYIYYVYLLFYFDNVIGFP